MGFTRVFGREFETTGVLGLSRDDGEVYAQAFPSWLTIPSHQWLSMARAWHFFFAWVFVPLSAGRIWLGETDVTEVSADARAELGLGRSFQDARLFPSMTVRQTISVARERHIRTRDPIAAALISPATRIAAR